MLLTVTATATALVFLALSLLHGYWAMGGTWAGSVVVPELAGKPTFRPGFAATLVVALLLLTAAAVVGTTAHLWSVPNLPSWVPRTATWVLAAVMVARFLGDFRYIGVFKRVRGTRFANLDTRLYAPLCLALAMGCVSVAVTGHP